MKTILPLLVLLVSFQFSFGQGKSIAVLHDSFGNIQLGELWARLDGLAQEMVYNPNLSGYVIIYPQKISAQQNFRRERLYQRQIFIRIYQYSTIDPNRFTIALGEERDDFQIELWKAPPDAELPFAIRENWSETSYDLTKPFIFGTEDINEAYPTFVPGLYARLLNENPNLRGHVVVYNQSRKEAAQRLKEFSYEFKIPLPRLKLFIVKNKRRSFGETEFWIVPQKKKQTGIIQQTPLLTKEECPQGGVVLSRFQIPEGKFQIKT